jgi:ATP-dependent RNA helicase SUPV3L1/SUV3
MMKLILNIIPIKKFKKETIKKVSNENPFKILKNLNLG